MQPNPSNNENVSVEKLLSLLQAGKINEAHNLGEKLSREFPSNLKIKNIFAATLAQIGKVDDAINLYESIISLDPESAPARNNFGAILRHAGQWELALTQFQEAITLNPLLINAHQGIAVALHQLGHFEKSKAAYLRSLLLRPEDFEIALGLVDLLNLSAEYNDAIKILKYLFFVNPKSPLLYTQLALSQIGVEKFDDALQNFDKAIKIDGTLIKAHRGKGILLQNFGQFEEATSCFSHALRLDPKNASLYSNLASVALKLGDDEDALSVNRKSLIINPRELEAFFNVGKIYQLRGDRGNSSISYSRALKLLSTVPSISKSGNITALIPFGRSGSLFVQSLFDGHPELLNIPGAFLKGWFSQEVWQLLRPDTRDKNWKSVFTKKIFKFLNLCSILIVARTL